MTRTTHYTPPQTIAPLVSYDAKGNQETKATMEVDHVYIPSADVACLQA